MAAVPERPGPPHRPSSFWAPWAANTTPTASRSAVSPYGRIARILPSKIFALGSLAAWDTGTLVRAPGRSRFPLEVAMISRRGFLGAGTTGAVALTAFTNESLTRVAAAAAAAADMPPNDVARDETYWREIQQGFTLDRTIINFNNGGRWPGPPGVPRAIQ